MDYKELWMEVGDIVQEALIKIITNKKKRKKAKWLSEEALQIAVKRRDVKGKGEKERYTHLNAEFQRIARKDKKIWKNLENSTGATGLEKSVFMAIPKKGNAKDCSNYGTNAFISNTSKVMLKILQVGLNNM